MCGYDHFQTKASPPFRAKGLLNHATSQEHAMVDEVHRKT